MSATVRAANKKHLRESPLSDTFIIETSQGTITIELDGEKAPLHAANFALYADAKFYDGLIFHRVIKDFMIQTGGHQANFAMKQATAPQVRNESLNGLKNLRGTLAAARTNDPDSASAQFFINLKDNAFLDGVPASQKAGYSVFGKVISGMDVVDKIATTKTGNKNGHGDVPLEAIVIKSVERAPK
ncbi:MAG: peptidylprolyl isomerase [Gemmataceae bacterium]|nr:peptidylprolyl isomerase [Gemmataceae bacterium]